MIEFDQYTIIDGKFKMLGTVKASLSPTPVRNQIYRKLVELKKEVIFITDPKTEKCATMGPHDTIVVTCNAKLKTEEDHDHERILTFIANMTEI